MYRSRGLSIKIKNFIHVYDVFPSPLHPSNWKHEYQGDPSDYSGELR